MPPLAARRDGGKREVRQAKMGKAGSEGKCRLARLRLAATRLRAAADRISGGGCGQANDQTLQDQPRRERAGTLQIEVGLEQPAVDLIAAMASEMAELLLGLANDERPDARLLQGAGEGDAAAGRFRPG